MLKNALRLFLVSLLILISSCAPKEVKLQAPSFEGADFRGYIEDRKRITDIDTTFSIVFEKDETEKRGDGALNISGTGDMSLRVYSLGFLAMELSSKNGVSKSSPRIDSSKMLMLTRGLRDCLFWWDIENASVTEEDGAYVLNGSDRTVWVDKKTFLPVRQQMYFDDGKELNVIYDVPALSGNIWYQSSIRIEYMRYQVVLEIKRIAFKS